MKQLKVFRMVPEAKLPTRAYPYDSGLDLYSIERKVLWPGSITLVRTGIKIKLEPGYEAQIRSKSGLALNAGLVVANSPGTVDYGYEGEVGVLIHNTRTTDYIIEAGQKIAQMIIQKVELPEVFEVTSVGDVMYSNEERGEGGFGSTGIK